MKPTTFLLLLIVVLATSGCRVKSYPRPVEPLQTLPDATDSACTDHRWIAIKKEADPTIACPSVESMVDGLIGWDTAPLWTHAEKPRAEFKATCWAPSALEASSQPSPFMPLSCFCYYQGDHGANLTELIGDLSHHGLLALQRDCMAVVPAQAVAAATTSKDGLAKLQSSTLERRFLNQAGRFERQSTAPVGAVVNAPLVRLAVVDTAPTFRAPIQIEPFNSEHGYVLLNMAHRLLPTQGGTPVVHLTSQLTLRFLELDRSLPEGARSDPNGGFFGSIGDLARDLRDEVTDWRSELANGSARHLVLSLSLGWNERFNVRAATAVVAVKAALADAVCRGALPIAAAGNQAWGADPSVGPLFPAAWEKQPAPSVAECAELIGIAPLDSYARGGYRPLVYAVGAVKASGAPLALDRSESEPRLVAFGDHGLVTTPLEPNALTGSSVATLIASATAATAWSGKPNLGAFELMDKIYEASQLVTPTRTADFALDATARPVRRLFVCPVAKALGGLTAQCPPQVGATQARFPNSHDALLTRIEPKARPKPFDTPETQRIDLRTYTREVPSLVGCPPTAILDPRRPESAREWLRIRRSPAARSPRTRNTLIRFPCPQWQAPAQWANGWANPQPGSNVCTTCGIEDGSPIGTAYLEIDSLVATRRRLSLPDPLLSNPVLKVGDTVYLLDNLDLTGPRPIRAIIRNIPLGQGEPIPVFFSLLMDGEFSSTSLLLGPEGLEPH